MDDMGQMELTTHINEHVNYPINKQGFMASCGNLSHLPADIREWVEGALPDRTFESADDAIHALNLPHHH